MILTVTINPSIDRTIALPGPLERGAVQRAADVTSQSAGKGVNVSRAVASAGLPTRAIVRADYHDPYVRDLVEDGLTVIAVDPGSVVRTNIALVEPDGTTTKINEPGQRLTQSGVEALRAAITAEARRARWVVIAGSLPPGAPDTLVADLVATAREAAPAARIAVDTSGAPLRALIDAGVGVDLIKPNADELAELVGGEPAAYESDPALVMGAFARLEQRGVTAMLATLGAAGAVAVDNSGAWLGSHLPVVARSTVGAGDSSLAGFLIAHCAGRPLEGCLAQAIAYGAAAVTLPGTTIPSPDDATPTAVTVSRLHPTDTVSTP